MSAIPSPFGGQLPIPSRAKQLDPPSGSAAAAARNWVLNGKAPAPFQAGVAKLVSRGYHQAVVVDTQRGSTRTHTPYYKIYFMIISGEHKDATVELTLWLTEKGRNQANQICWSLGYTDVEQLAQTDIVGRVCMIYVNHDQNCHGVTTCGVTGIMRLANEPPPKANDTRWSQPSSPVNGSG